MSSNSFLIVVFFICGSFSADFLFIKIKSKNKLRKLLIDCCYFSTLFVFYQILTVLNFVLFFLFGFFVLFFLYIVFEEIKEIQIFNRLKQFLNFFSECLIEVKLGSSFKAAAKTQSFCLNSTDKEKIIKMIHGKHDNSRNKSEFFFDEVILLLNQNGSQINSLQSILDKLKIELKLRQRSRESLFKNKIQMVFVISLYLLLLVKSVLLKELHFSSEFFISSFGIFIGVFLMHLNSYRWKWTT